jgi:hypothetical protein
MTSKEPNTNLKESETLKLMVGIQLFLVCPETNNVSLLSPHIFLSILPIHDAYTHN